MKEVAEGVAVGACTVVAARVDVLGEVVAVVEIVDMEVEETLEVA